MSIVLGIASSHDASAALYKDGRLVAALSEERLSRIKCDGERLPERAIDEVLRLGGVTRKDVDHVAMILGFFPETYFRRPSVIKELERRISRFRRELGGKETKQVLANELQRQQAVLGKTIDELFRPDVFLSGEGFRPDTDVAIIDHHQTHAAAAAYYSGFDDALVITMDAEGDLNVHTTVSRWMQGKLSLDLSCADAGASAGHFYATITSLLGFMPMRHEGKVLGLAAFGEPAPLLPAMRKALRLADSGDRLTSDFIDIPQPNDRRREYLAEAIAGHTRETVAAAAQTVFEESIVAIVRHHLRRTGLRKLALNGGVFANVKLNQRLAALPELDKIFVFPGMSDTGNSIGAALLLQDRLSPGFMASASQPLIDVYWGPEASDVAIENELRRQNLAYEHLSEDELIERAAQAIHKGDVVGWFQGRMEFGPRALGNRSMVGRPTEAGINKSLNDRLERTEFMPFAPSTLIEYADELFDNVAKAAHPAEFMTVTFDVKKAWHDRIPAVVHVDGTARPQLVRKDTNPRYWKLIERYRQLSGIPVVLNTSFNVHEEPIVCGPEEGVRALAEDRIDRLAIGNFWVQGTRP